jgi:hypothetical protein
MMTIVGKEVMLQKDINTGDDNEDWTDEHWWRGTYKWREAKEDSIKNLRMWERKRTRMFEIEGWKDKRGKEKMKADLWGRWWRCVIWYVVVVGNFVGEEIWGGGTTTVIGSGVAVEGCKK